MGALRRQYVEWTAEALAAVRAELGENCLGVAVYGSVARGTPHEGSDIDLLVVARTLPPGRGSRAAVAQTVEDAFHSQVGVNAPDLSLLLRTAEELEIGFPLLLEIWADGQVLDDPTGALSSALAAFQRRIERRGAQRKRSGDFWHWDLQGDSRPGEWEL